PKEIRRISLGVSSPSRAAPSPATRSARVPAGPAATAAAARAGGSSTTGPPPTPGNPPPPPTPSVSAAPAPGNKPAAGAAARKRRGRRGHRWRAVPHPGGRGLRRPGNAYLRQPRLHQQRRHLRRPGGVQRACLTKRAAPFHIVRRTSLSFI